MEDEQLRGEAMNQVEKFNYLGSEMVINWQCTHDVEKKRAATTRAFRTLRPRL